MSISTADNALLSQDSYKDRKLNELIKLGGIEYKIFDHIDNPSTGYQATAYQRSDTGEIVIAHRGTEFDREPVHDGSVDAGMVLTGLNAQTTEAMAFTKKVIDEAKKDASEHHYPLNISVTGHSLGGTLAEITAYEYGLHGETFNAYGAASLLQGIPHGGHQVIDHVRAGDVVSAASPHFGEVRIYAAEQDIDKLSKAGYLDDGGLLSPRNPVKAINFGAHAIDNFVPDSKTLGTSIISPENEARYRAHHGMIDRYRADVMDLRTGLSAHWEIPKRAAESGMAFGRSVAHEIAQDVHAVEQGAKHAAHAVEHAAQYASREATRAAREVEHGVRHAAQAVEHTARNVAHTAGESFSQGVHITHHAVSQGIHAAEHAAHSLTSDASKAFDALRHPGSWFNDKPAPAAAPVRLDQTTHPDHPLYQQTRNAVHRLDAEHHRTPDQHSDNLAASLVVAARRDGLQAVNQVVLSNDAARTFAVQGELNSSFKQITHVETARASNTPIEQSSAAWQQVMQQKQQEQPAMAPPMPQPAPSPGMSR
ncbi:MAG: XVIPCD domain-containing protein [Rhodanobacter sp.]